MLGLNLGHTEPGWSVFRLPSGRSDFVEVFGPEHDNAGVFPAEVHDGIVVAFAFRGPDRNVYAMQQDSRTHAA